MVKRIAHLCKLRRAYTQTRYFHWESLTLTNYVDKKIHRQDQILPPAQYAQKFIDDIATARLEWVEDCGHVPHLEQPILTADTIAAFVAK